MTESHRYHAIFRGDVQGVGFRYVTFSLARSWPLRGYVKNLPDGTVELLAQGRRGEVEAFLNKLNDRLDRYIEGREENWSLASEDPGPFHIQY